MCSLKKELCCIGGDNGLLVQAVFKCGASGFGDWINPLESRVLASPGAAAIITVMIAFNE